MREPSLAELNDSIEHLGTLASEIQKVIDDTPANLPRTKALLQYMKLELMERRILLVRQAAMIQRMSLKK